MCVQFVSPFHPEVRAHEHKVITEALTKFEFDGVRLDCTYLSSCTLLCIQTQTDRYAFAVVRFDSDFADLSNYTRSLFKEKHGLDPATSLLHNTRLSPDWLKWVPQGVCATRANLTSRALCLPRRLTFGQHISPHSLRKRCTLSER